MNESNPLIVYSKSTNTSYNYFVICLIMIVTYVLISKKIPNVYNNKPTVMYFIKNEI